MLHKHLLNLSLLTVALTLHISNRLNLIFMSSQVFLHVEILGILFVML
jgi:hypothetical protein